MDALTGLLDGPRARGAFLLRCVMAPPWALRVQDGAPLTVVALVSGSATVAPASGPAVTLQPGDVAVVRGPEPYELRDVAGSPVVAVIHPGQRCTTPDGVELAQAWHHGVRTWGNDPAGPTTMLVGTYEASGEVGDRLLRTLPPALVVPGSGTPLVPLLAAEVGRDDPGQEAVLDRLLDLLVISVLREWFARPDADAPAWYRAWGDPVVGVALRTIHHSPAEPWTVEGLARLAGVSRATFSRRFTELLGEPPMAFLTGWRIALAADLLADPDATVGAVARQVGYGTPFALSTAFKRVRGVSPAAYRQGLRAA